MTVQRTAPASFLSSSFLSSALPRQSAEEYHAGGDLTGASPVGGQGERGGELQQQADAVWGARLEQALALQLRQLGRHLQPAGLLHALQPGLHTQQHPQC